MTVRYPPVQAPLSSEISSLVTFMYESPSSKKKRTISTAGTAITQKRASGETSEAIQQKKLGPRKAIRNLSFKVKPGQHVA